MQVALVVPVLSLGYRQDLLALEQQLVSIGPEGALEGESQNSLWPLGLGVGNEFLAEIFRLQLLELLVVPVFFAADGEREVVDLAFALVVVFAFFALFL